MNSQFATDSSRNGGGVQSIVFAMTGAAATHGGIATANLNTLRALQRLAKERKLSLNILSLNETNMDRPQFVPGEIPFEAFGGSKFRFSLALLRSFSRQRLYVFDHVRLAFPLSPFLAFGRGECVICAHGSESWQRVRPSSRWLFRRARLCLTNSSVTLKKMRQRFNGFTGVECLLGLSPEHELNVHIPTSPARRPRLRAVDGEERDIGDRMILLVGRMDSREGQKGHTQLLNIWQMVLTRFPNAQLVFAGPGNDRERLSAHARTLGVDASVFIPGLQSSAALQELYRACYAFVMPSRQEGFGLVYLEAMNYAKPCIGCIDNGCEDVIVDGETGYLVSDPDDHVELRDALSRLLSSESEASRLGKQGWSRLHERFTSEQAQERIIERLTPLL